MMRGVALILALILALAAPVAASAADTPLQSMVEALLAQGPPGTRYGLAVTTLDGEPLLTIAPDQRFIAASNTKMFVTATGYADLNALQSAAMGTGVRLEPRGNDRFDVVLHGAGDALLASGDGCTTDCLQTLADAVAARTRRVHDIIGDDSLFPTERWGLGMSWNNIQSRYGTGISALTLDDNEVSAIIAPGTGATPAVTTSPYYTVDNRIVTVAGTTEAVVAERAPGSRLVRLTGTIGASAAPTTLHFSIDDPAHYAAWRLGTLLEARGVVVTGAIGTRHRPLAPQDDPAVRGTAPPPRPPTPELLASLQNATFFGAELSGRAWPFTNGFGATQIMAVLLIIGMTAVLFITQLQLMRKNMPPEALTGPMAQQQKMMLYLFPFMYAVGGAWIPVGVLVYWFTTNLWTLAQQYFLIHNNPTPGTPAHVDWQERMRAKGQDPDEIERERRAKLRGKAKATPAGSTTTADGETKATVARQGSARSVVKTDASGTKQVVTRQQPARQTRAARKKQ